MEIKPLILGALFIFLLYFLFNPPTGDGGAKHGDKGGKDKKPH